MDETSTRWFFIDEAGNLRGPATVQTLSVLVEGGVVTPSTQMRRKDSEEWARADTFFDFTDGHPPSSPPAESAPPSASASTEAPPSPGAGEWTPPEIPEEARRMLVGDSPPPAWTEPAIPDVIDKTPRRGLWNSLAMSEADRRGNEGEKEVFALLKRRLPIGGDHGYRIVRNLMFETPTGTTQLDLTVVSAYGIFIVEVKNYQGWIFGDPAQSRWTQSLKGGRKFQFQNPIRQNFKHLAVMSERTGIPQNLIFPVIAFSPDSEFKTEMPANVMHFRDVPGYIRKFTSVVIKPGQLTEIVEALLSWDDAIDREKKREHVQNLKDAHAPMPVDAHNVLCPVCGNRMVLRHGRKDGHPFWGCSKYPGCKGMREAVN